MDKETVLIFGGGGRVGRGLVAALSPNYQIVDPSSKDCNITSFPQLKELFKKVKPEVVINCTMSNISVDEAEKPENRRTVLKVNAEAAAHIAALSEQYQAYCLYFGTDYVFDGTLQDRLYREDDRKSPLSIYGVSKSLGEDMTLESCKRAAVLRIASPYSDSCSAPPDIVSTFESMLGQGKTITGVTDSICTPILVGDVVAAVKLLVDARETGIWHAVGTRTTPFQMARIVAEIGNYPTDLVVPISFADYNCRLARRPQNSGLDSTKFINRFGNIFTSTPKGIARAVRARQSVTA